MNRFALSTAALTILFTSRPTFVTAGGQAHAVMTIRVALVRAARGAASVTVRAGGGSRLTDPLDSHLGAGPAEWTFTAGDTVEACDRSGRTVASGPALRVVPGSASEPLTLRFGEARPVRYRGMVELGADNGTLCVTNTLPLEEYLRGVVPAEIRDDAPLEALKAQAIAARTFALRTSERFKGRSFDVTDDTDCQVYRGADAERPPTDQAVEETAGLALMRGGRLILADYFDDCGGVTAPGDSADDFPPSVIDSPADSKESYCARGSRHTWRIEMTCEDLESLLSRRKEGRFGRLRSMRVAKTDASGRVTTLELKGDSRSLSLSGAAFRAIVGYSRLPSARFTVSREGDVFVLNGSGYGHGRGMCQEGAIGMASAPFNQRFDAILEHYFPGARILPATEAESAHGRR